MKIVLKKYWVFILLFLSAACEQNEMPSVHINLLEDIGWKYKTKGEFIFSKSPNDTLKGKLKLRGGMSSRYNKHSYTIEFDSLFCPGSLPCDDDFILNANYIDKSFMRHKISYDLFREMSPSNKSVRSSYIELYLNNQYDGLYVLMEKINASFLGLNKSDSLSMLFKDPPIFRTKPYKKLDTGNIYNQKYPKFTVCNQSDYLETFRDFLFNSSDSEFTNHIKDWIDVKSVMDWHILLLLTHNGDGLQKNFYLYKQDANTPFKIAIWDYDHTFGRDGDNEKNDYRKVMFFENSIVLNRLMQIESTNYKKEIKERWSELRSSSIISVQSLIRHMDKNYANIIEDVSKNSERWPVSEKWYFDNYTIKEELGLMKKYVKFKVNALDTYFLELN